MKNKVGCLLVIGFELFFGIILVMLPLIIWLALQTSPGTEINEIYLIQAFSDLLNEGDLIYFNIIAVVLCSILQMTGVFSEISYTMSTMADFTLETLLLCVFGTLFMLCFIKVKLEMFSFVFRILRGSWLDFTIRSLDASLTYLGFLICNILGKRMIKSDNPVFWVISMSLICVLLILSEKYFSLHGFMGEYSFFGSLNIIEKLFGGIVNAVSATLMVFFIYYMAKTTMLPTNTVGVALIACTQYLGLYLSMISMADDEKWLKKILCFAAALGLFYVLSRYN